MAVLVVGGIEYPDFGCGGGGGWVVVELMDGPTSW